VELRQLKYFVTVAEELHFGRAAKKLFISQPPLSLQIQNLEKELGVELLQRTQRRVALTPEGRAFYQRAKTILASAQIAVEEVQRISRGERDVIRVGYMSSVMLGEFAPMLRQYHEQYPGVEILMQQMASDRQYESLVDGNIDAAFVDLSVGEMHDHFRRHQFDGCRVLHERLYLAVPKGHSLARKRRLSLADVASQEFIVFPRRSFPSFYDTVISLCRNSGFSPVIRGEAGQMPELLAYVAAGIGIGIAPDCARHSWGRFVDFIPLAEEAYVDIWLITQANAARSVRNLRQLAERWVTGRGMEFLSLRNILDRAG